VRSVAPTTAVWAWRFPLAGIRRRAGCKGRLIAEYAGNVPLATSEEERRNVAAAYGFFGVSIILKSFHTCANSSGISPRFLSFHSAKEMTGLNRGKTVSTRTTSQQANR